MTITRQMITDEATDWLGTPYRHTASTKGVSTDCAGLIRGVYKAVVGSEPDIEYPSYSPDWQETGEEQLLPILREHLTEVPTGNALPGDILVFRMGLGTPAKHCAILTAPDRVIHTYWGRSVTETRLVSWWERRVCAAFEFPL